MRLLAFRNTCRIGLRLRWDLTCTLVSLHLFLWHTSIKSDVCHCPIGSRSERGNRLQLLRARCDLSSGQDHTRSPTGAAKVDRNGKDKTENGRMIPVFAAFSCGLPWSANLLLINAKLLQAAFLHTPRYKKRTAGADGCCSVRVVRSCRNYTQSVRT